MAPTGTEVVVATFNLHAGVDGWGRPYDVVEACRRLDADVLVLEEVWWPDDGPSFVDAAAGALGYAVVGHVLGTGRLGAPDPRADEHWMPRSGWTTSHALYLDSERPLSERTRASLRFRSAQPGRFGLAVLSRLPVGGHHVIELGRRPRDRVRRAAVVVDVETAAGRLTAVGVHMAHLTQGSPYQFATLARALPAATAGSVGAVVAGDMNLWGPATVALFRGWRRAVRGRTWPAWRPHSQVDHILLRGSLAVRDGRVEGPAGSDHRAVVARLVVDAPGSSAALDPETRRANSPN